MLVSCKLLYKRVIKSIQGGTTLYFPDVCKHNSNSYNKITLNNFHPFQSWNNKKLQNNSEFSPHLFHCLYETSPVLQRPVSEFPLRRREEPQSSAERRCSASWNTEGRLSRLRSPLRQRSTRVTLRFPAPVKTSVFLQLFIGGWPHRGLPECKHACQASCDVRDLDVLTQISSPWCRFKMKRVHRWQNDVFVYCKQTSALLLHYSGFYCAIANKTGRNVTALIIAQLHILPHLMERCKLIRNQHLQTAGCNVNVCHWKRAAWISNYQSAPRLQIKCSRK